MTESTGAAEREVLTWTEYGVGVRELARLIADDGFRPDVILGIARGGLIPTGSLGYALSIKNCYLINVEYYTDVDERLEVPVILPPYLELVDLEHANILVVDDVADTGHTLAKVYEFVAGSVRSAKAAVLYEKPRSVIKCEYVWRRTDLWINFPWSTEPPIVAPTRHRRGIEIPPI
ncbi:MAG: phosphoribosyltransferase [Acidimicrobiia bacterium]|nr:MAG: phosphoribosyltransferase [Acidimicrobiia bacterium]